jgi:hypothetical protein
MLNRKVLLNFVAPLLMALAANSFAARDEQGVKSFTIENGLIQRSVTFEDDALISDKLTALPDLVAGFGSEPFTLETDADFRLDLMWTGWSAPGKADNAENPIALTKADFVLVNAEQTDFPGRGGELKLLLKVKTGSLEVLLTYRLEKDSFFARRKLAIRDPKARRHFLRWTWPMYTRVSGNITVIKPGGFGQPVAFLIADGGAFAGLEYPTAENRLEALPGGSTLLRCGGETGERVGESWIESEWVVTGLTPNPHVKLWFWKYLDTIRVAPLRPYLLYNSWYDVRAPEYTDRPEDVMNEQNILRIVGDFKREMYEKRGLRLDAFVLDDGWDVYKSDWALRPDEFPNGLRPVVAALREMDTSLGLWFGPIGGYSHRDWRVGWMRGHGYETIGDQMCIAGADYNRLFNKRVIDFVRDDGIAYYKWDGIQFSCSEPDHGHPIDIYSRRAVMEAVIDLCRAVRAENPEMFLNVTSGTWLSPWWVKYANMIWMQGQDYGYADVPSISRRDAAITYRDYVLYEDFHKNGFWFPIANLMTHGIIKGHLQKLGGEAEPLDKFTDNALLYFARGVSMWELYISPNLLSDSEWDALTGSIRWARDRFGILRSTEMIGGDPGGRRAYGYAHFAGKRGIIAARNPFIEPQSLTAALDPALGLDADASSLVLERLYPTRWISPRLYSAGETLEIPLAGYETAVYEIYPLLEADRPLPAGLTFDVLHDEGRDYKVVIYDAAEGARLLNPDAATSLAIDGEPVSLELGIPVKEPADPVTDTSVTGKDSELQIEFELGEPAKSATLALLLEPSGASKGGEDPAVTATLDGRALEPDVEKQKGSWGWYKLSLEPGSHSAEFRITIAGESGKWQGRASVWLVCSVQPPGMELAFKLKTAPDSRRPAPPRPWPAGELRRNVKLGEVDF